MAETTLQGHKAIELYHRYVGEPESRRDVYGYWLFLLGCLCGLFGVLIFQFEQAFLATDFAIREIAIVLAAFGLAVGLFGIVVLLPVRRRGMHASIIGLLIAFGAIGLFTWAYPHAWYVEPDYSAEIIGLYAIGITIVAGVAVLVPIVTGERGLLVEPELGIGSSEPPILLGDADRDAFYTIYQTDEKAWTWRVIQRDAVAESLLESATDTDATLHIEKMREKIGRAGLIEITTAAFRLYRTADDAWRWTLTREDGGVVGTNARNYPTRDAVETATNFCKEQIPEAGLVEIHGAAIDVYEDDAERWHWRLVDEDRNTLVEGAQRFDTEAPADADAATFSALVDDARVLVVEALATELYADDDGWRWRILDQHGRPLATSEGAFDERREAERNANAIATVLEGANTIEYGTPGFEIITEGDQWTWRLRTSGDDTIARRSGAPVPRDVAEDAADRSRQIVEDAVVVESTGADYEVYADYEAYHWRLVTDDRRILATSTEEFDDRDMATGAAERVKDRAQAADLIEFERAAFQQYESDGEWRWRLIDEDGQVISDSGEAFASKEAVREGMVKLKEHAPDAEVLEIDTAAFELYRTEDGAWAWRLIDEGGALIAAAAETFDSRAAARSAVEFLLEHVDDADLRRMDHGAFHLRAENGDWTFFLIHPDGTILAEAVDAYPTRDDALAAIETVRNEGSAAATEKVWPVAVQVYVEGGVRWRVIDTDRTVLARGERTYGSREEATGDINRVTANAARAPVFTFDTGVIWVAEDEIGWRWRVLDVERQAVARGVGSEATRDDALDVIETVQSTASEAGAFDIDVLAFEVFHDDAGWQWRLLDEEESIVAVCDAPFANREELLLAIEELRGLVTDASIIEIDEAAFEFHERAGKWLWRLVDEHGQPIAESVKQHETRRAARDDMLLVKEFAPAGEISVAY